MNREPAIELQRKSGIPLYVQIRQGLRRQIERGILAREQRLPPERELASELGVSRNTVSQAYEDLEREGLVDSRVGDGTFVSDRAGSAGEQSRSQVLGRHIRHAVEEALALGFGLEEFESAVLEYIDSRKEPMARIRVVFIECNVEQANYFGHHLELDPGVVLVPLLLGDLQAGRPGALAEVRDADMVVTSFYHLAEVRSLFPDLDREIIGVSLAPAVATIIRLARIRPDSTVGIVTSSTQFREEIERSLRKNELSFPRLAGTTGSGKELDRVLRRADAVVVSPGRREEVTERVDSGTEVIEFVFTPDRTSINNLKAAFLDLKQVRDG